MALALRTTKPVSDDVPKLVSPSGEASFTSGRRAAIFASLPKIEKNTMLHLATNGKWSSHQMLVNLLHITGPAHVGIATYSMTEEPTRMLVNYIEIGQILSLQFLSDLRFKTHQPEAYALASNHFQIHLASSHMKLITIYNDDWNISVVGSANFTQNKRRELCLVIEDKATCDFYKSVLKNVIDGND